MPCFYKGSGMGEGIQTPVQVLTEVSDQYLRHTRKLQARIASMDILSEYRKPRHRMACCLRDIVWEHGEGSNFFVIGRSAYLGQVTCSFVNLHFGPRMVSCYLVFGCK